MLEKYDSKIIHILNCNSISMNSIWNYSLLNLIIWEDWKTGSKKSQEKMIPKLSWVARFDKELVDTSIFESTTFFYNLLGFCGTKVHVDRYLAFLSHLSLDLFDLVLFQWKVKGSKIKWKFSNFNCRNGAHNFKVFSCCQLTFFDIEKFSPIS